MRRTSPRLARIGARFHQFRHQFGQLLQLRQLGQFGHPQRQGRPQPQLRHQLPQANCKLSCPAAVSPSCANAETASRIAASRSETGADARGCSPSGCSFAELGVEPRSIDTPTIPAGTISDRMARYFCRSDMQGLSSSRSRSGSGPGREYRPIVSCRWRRPAAPALRRPEPRMLRDARSLRRAASS